MKKHLGFELFLFILSIVILFPPVFLLRGWVSLPTAYMKRENGFVYHQWAPASQIPRHLKRAVVAAEDGSFFEHWGIDFEEMRKSVATNIERKEFSRGFSTISMQLARNLYLYGDKTILRKIVEIFIATKMELFLSKERILEIYLNVVEWGPHIYGVEAASRHYFKKHTSQLSMEESIFLASILPSPKKWGHWPPMPHVAKRMRLIRSLVSKQ